MIVIENGFTDFIGKAATTVGKGIKKVSDTAYNLYDKGKRAYDYYSGNSDTKYNFSQDASTSDLNKTAIKTYVKDFNAKDPETKKPLYKYKATKDPKSGMIKFVVSADAVPKNFANRIMPNSSRTDSLYPFVVNYNSSRKEITLELPMDNGESAKKMTQRNRDKLNKEKSKNTVKPDSEEESVMTPTPIPYKGYQVDKEGHLIKESYIKLSHKSVSDSDGFNTDYTLYYDTDNEKYITIFGDEDLYSPEDTEPDFETSDEDEAYEWFNSYEGFIDEYDEDSDGHIDWESRTDRFDDIESPYYNGDLEDSDFEEESCRKESDNSRLADTLVKEFSKEGSSFDADRLGQIWCDINEKYRDSDLADHVIDELSKTHEESCELKDVEEDILTETPGLELSIPEVKYRGQDDYEGYLTIEINGKSYDYELKPGTDKTADELANKIVKIKKYSDGKALAYLKKNAKLKESVKSVRQILRGLRVQISKALREIMMSPEFGFEPDEVDLYSGFSVTPEDGYIAVSVNAEVSYDSLWEIKDKLDPIIQKYDSESYFDMEDSGRIIAYLAIKGTTPDIEESKKVNESVFVLKEETSLTEALNYSPEMKALARAMKKIVTDSNDETRELIMQIMDEVVPADGEDTSKEESLKEGNPFKSHHICQGCGKSLDQCTCEVKEEDVDLDSLEESYKLGDTVSWKGHQYVIIDDENDEDLFVLRPVDKFQDSDFDDIDIGDSSEDVILSKSQLTESLNEGTKLKRIARYKEFDNGHVLHDDWKEMTNEEAEDLAKQMSLKDPDDIYYVAYDDLMDSSSDVRWINGKSYNYDTVGIMGDKPYIKGTLEESDNDVVVSNSTGIIDLVIDHYGTVSEPYEGPSFILPNGEYLNIKDCKNHADVEFWLDSQGKSKYDDYNRRSGSPTLKALGCIRVDTPKYYIQLPPDNITSRQYSSLKDWVDFLMTCNVPFIEVTAPGAHPVRYNFSDPDIDADYVTNRVRRYYISGTLYESNEDPAEMPADKIDEEQVVAEGLDSLVHYIDDDGYVSIDNISNFITDAYDGELDDRYSCIASIIHDYKDEGKVSIEVINQYAGAHNLSDKSIDESATQPSNIGQHKTSSIDLIEEDESK